MNYDPEQHIADDATVLNEDEPTVMYAETGAGPWTIEYETEWDGPFATRVHPERIKVSGPFIGDEYVHEYTGALRSAIEKCGGWRYVERGDR